MATASLTTMIPPATNAEITVWTPGKCATEISLRTEANLAARGAPAMPQDTSNAISASSISATASPLPLKPAEMGFWTPGKCAMEDYLPAVKLHAAHGTKNMVPASSHAMIV